MSWIPCCAFYPNCIHRIHYQPPTPYSYRNYTPNYTPYAFQPHMQPVQTQIPCSYQTHIQPVQTHMMNSFNNPSIPITNTVTAPYQTQSFTPQYHPSHGNQHAVTIHQNYNLQYEQPTTNTNTEIKNTQKRKRSIIDHNNDAEHIQRPPNKRVKLSMNNNNNNKIDISKEEQNKNNNVYSKHELFGRATAIIIAILSDNNNSLSKTKLSLNFKEYNNGKTWGNSFGCNDKIGCNFKIKSKSNNKNYIISLKLKQNK
eukprot:144446_1